MKQSFIQAPLKKGKSLTGFISEAIFRCLPIRLVSRKLLQKESHIDNLSFVVEKFILMQGGLQLVLGTMRLLKRNCESFYSSDQRKFPRIRDSITTSLGFTMIEILLVVVILGVISVISIPNFSQAHKNMVLKKQAEDISYLMRYAQSRAIVKGKHIQFKFNNEFSSYRLLEEEGDVHYIEDMEFHPFPSRLSRVRKIKNNINVQSDVSSIMFYPDGKIERVNFDVCNKRKCFILTTKVQRGSVRMLGPENNE